jgi:hypothetical protein
MIQRGVKDYVDTYYYLPQEEKDQKIELYENLIKLNNEHDEIYTIEKYNPTYKLCRSHSVNTPLERIKTQGLYSYIDVYGGGSTGSKLQTYYKMITDPELFEAHCDALIKLDNLSSVLA